MESGSRIDLHYNGAGELRASMDQAPSPRTLPGLQAEVHEPARAWDQAPQPGGE